MSVIEMKRLALLLPIGLFAAVPPNSVTIRDSSGSGQTGAPFTISRVFAQGEITDFARPVVAGAPAELWQCDVKTRWRDGRASLPITAITGGAPILVSAPGHGFRFGEKVEISGVTGIEAANGIWTVGSPTAGTFQLMNSNGGGAYGGGGIASGPASGSLQHALVSFRADIPAGGAVTVSFEGSQDTCSAGNRSACDAAALTQPQMLEFNGGGWDSAMETSVNGNAHTASARAMVAAGAWSYWLRGPVATQVIVEDRSTARAFDFGYKDRHVMVLNSPTATILATATSIPVVDASEMAALHPGTGSSTRQVRLRGEDIAICGVNGNTLQVGYLTCPGVDGRGRNGTKATAYPPGLDFAQVIQIQDIGTQDGWKNRVVQRNYLDSNVPFRADSIMAEVYTPEFLQNRSFPVTIQIDDEQISVCGVYFTSPGLMFFGTDTANCAIPIRSISSNGAGMARLTFKDPKAPFSTAAYAHTFQTGALLRIGGAVEASGINGAWPATVVDPFTVDINVPYRSFYGSSYGAAQVEGHSGRGRNGTTAATHNRYSWIHDLSWSSDWQPATAPQYKSLHPVFILTFYPGWNGVRTQYIMENTWSGSLQDQYYNLTLKTGSAGTVYTKPVNHVSQTRWEKIYWDGAEPPASSIDYNLAHLAYSGAIPNFDASLVMPESAAQAEVAKFLQADPDNDLYGYGMWQAGMGTPGGRGDLGEIPRWFVRYLYSFSPEFRDTAFLGNARVSGYVPLHFRESDTNRSFDELGVVNGFGRPLSLNGRPRWKAQRWDQGSGDFLMPVGMTSNLAKSSAARSLDNWGLDLAHQPDMYTVPYLITGNPYFLEEIYYWAAYNLLFSSPGTTAASSRHDNWGVINEGNAEVRGLAWAIRSVGYAAFFAPDGSAEKTYYIEKLNRNLAAREGALDLKNGTFYDTSAESAWSWGRNVLAGGMDNQLNWPTRFAGGPIADGAGKAGCFSIAPWMSNFNLVAFGQLPDLGFSQAKPYAEAILKNLLHQILDSGYQAAPLLAAYYVSTRADGNPCVNGSGLPTTASYGWSQVKSSVPGSEFTNATNRWNNGIAVTDEAYPAIAWAAASFLPGIVDSGLDGQAAWDWMKANVRNQANNAVNPTWAFLPREGSPRPVRGPALRGRAAGAGKAEAK